jgi:hypothetical protein
MIQIDDVTVQALPLYDNNSKINLGCVEFRGSSILLFVVEIITITILADGWKRVFNLFVKRRDKNDIFGSNVCPEREVRLLLRNIWSERSVEAFMALTSPHTHTPHTHMRQSKAAGSAARLSPSFD